VIGRSRINAMPITNHTTACTAIVRVHEPHEAEAL
jgi:hypothetical protein